MPFSSVQQIIDRVSRDVRQILDSSSSTDQPVLIDYTNRIQLQLLREARWRFLLSNPFQFVTIPGYTDYWIGATGANPTTIYSLTAVTQSTGGNATYTGNNLEFLAAGVTCTIAGFVNGVNNGTFVVTSATPTTVVLNNTAAIAETHTGTLSVVMPDTASNITNFGEVKAGTVFDRTNFLRLYPTDEPPLGPGFNSLNRPKLYRDDQNTPGVFSIYPPAQAPYVIEFRYFFAKPQLALVTDTLIIPNDYLDVVVAGVNWFGNLYLRENYNDAQMWKQIYAEGIQGMKRDANLFPRGNEFMAPDPATQARTQVIPIGLDSGIETSLP